MRKDVFVRALKALEAQMEYDISKSEELGKVFPNAFSANLIYDNSKLFDTVIEMLEVATEDKESWIHHFCYELDFGKEEYRLKSFDKDGKVIPLSTPEELFDFLESEKKSLKIELEEYNTTCGDGCCTNYGTITKVNGVRMPFENSDVVTILSGVLEHLNYKVDIEQTYDFD